MTGCMFNPYCAREDLIESLNIVYFTEMLKISVYFSTAEQKRDVCSCSLKRRRRLAYRFFLFILFYLFFLVLRKSGLIVFSVLEWFSGHIVDCHSRQNVFKTAKLTFVKLFYIAFSNWVAY